MTAIASLNLKVQGECMENFIMRTVSSLLQIIGVTAIFITCAIVLGYRDRLDAYMILVAFCIGLPSSVMIFSGGEIMANILDRKIV
jgi:hypothetical protein